MIVKINDDVFIDRDEFASVQKEVVINYCGTSISDNSSYKSFNGVIITLKNGRKVAINDMEPKQIYELLK